MMILPPINFSSSSEINSVNLIQVHRVGWDTLSPTKLSDYRSTWWNSIVAKQIRGTNARLMRETFMMIM